MNRLFGFSIRGFRVDRFSGFLIPLKYRVEIVKRELKLNTGLLNFNKTETNHGIIYSVSKHNLTLVS